jgi:hypothetical protein
MRTQAPSRAEGLALLAILALSVALRLHNIGVPLVDTSDWRQTDTAAIAYFYYHLGVQMLHPQLWHDGPGPDYTQLEFQITPAIVAALAHLVGFGHTLLRAVALALFSCAAVPLWALVRRHYGPSTALWTCLVYVLLPVGIFFGRTFQPENAQLFFGMAGLWAADRFGERRTLSRFGVAAVALSLAVLAKLPNLMLLVPAAALADQDILWKWRQIFSWRRFLEAAGIVLIPTGIGAAYTLGQSAITTAAGGTRYVNFIVLSLADHYIAGVTNLGHFVWHDVLGIAVTPAGVVLGLIGAVALWRTRRAGWVWAWTGAVLVYGGVVLRAIRFQYYLMPLLPFFALFAGAGLAVLTGPAVRRLPRIAAWLPQVGAAALVVSILASGLFEIQAYWTPYWPWYHQGVALRTYLPADATVILSGTYNPTLLYYARRHGYRASPLTMSELRADVAGGARYVLDDGGLDTCMADYFAQNFQAVGVAGLTVWKLPAHLPPPLGNLSGNCLD